MTSHHAGADENLVDAPKPGRAPGYGVLALPRFRRDPLATLVAAEREKGDVVRFGFGPLLLHAVTHPRDVAHVLVDNGKAYDKGSVGYGKLRLALGDGLLTSEGDTWRRRRRIIQPAFHHDKIARFGSTVTASTRAMVDAWSARAAGGERLDIAKEMMALALDIITKAMFSADVGEDVEELGDLMTIGVRHVSERMMALSSIFEFPDKLPTPANRRFRDAIRAGDDMVRVRIEERRRSSADPGDLLSLLMAVRDADTGEGMTETELRDEIITIFAAGHETTANVLAWTFYLLSTHPEVERALHEEVDRVLAGRDDGTPLPADAPLLEYTTAVVKESMRLFPPAWAISRRALEDDVVGGFRIPKGSAVILSPFVTQRRADLFPSPDTFDPDRFRFGREAELPRMAYFPFGGGQRLCIGKSLAMLESVLVVAMIAKRFRLALDPEHEVGLEALVTLRPRGGMPMFAAPR